MAVSALVHLVTGGLAVGGALLAVLGWETIVQPVLGLLLVSLAAQLRPRLGKVDEEHFLRRADAPRVFALLDDIAEAVGTRGFDAVRLTPGFAISAVPYGLRGRRLDVGLALWKTLTPQQRVACLARALGHFATGDVRHRLTVRTALSLLDGPAAPSGDPDALREQALAVSPVSRRADDMAQAAGRFRVDSALSRWGVRLTAWPLKQAARLAQRLAAPVAEEAEHRSDALAARVASTEAAVRARERLALAGAVEAELRRMAVEARTFGRRNAAQGLWRQLAAYAADLPGGAVLRETERVRITLLDEADRCPPLVTLDPTAAEAVDRELEPAERAVAERFVHDGAGP
ncbi:M48 family metallopeptidase [Streptomyces sp. enrichment culture]|uniref:M48 family metallopeptidase n=1 Tax=Streptomyces sp. enrichment culture TaxID=1795815 RepID=UPI003F5498DD